MLLSKEQANTIYNALMYLNNLHVRSFETSFTVVRAGEPQHVNFKYHETFVQPNIHVFLQGEGDSPIEPEVYGTQQDFIDAYELA